MTTVTKKTGGPSGGSSKPQKKQFTPEGKERVNNIINIQKRIVWIKNEKNETLEGKFEPITNKLANIVTEAFKGVKTEIFYSFAHTVDMPDKVLADIINTSVKTISNYDEQKKPLEPVKGEHLLKLIALFKKGEEVFGNLTEFRGWLSKPQYGSDIVPLDWLITPGGIDLISNELDRIAHGYSL